VTLDTSLSDTDDRGVDLVDLDDSLRKLAECNERHARVAELRLFSGLSIDETAAALGVSPRSVDADWAMAKAWLRRELAASR
jgi:DNA-directed RNA polymerase specialized sigma24 family protein